MQKMHQREVNISPVCTIGVLKKPFAGKKEHSQSAIKRKAEIDALFPVHFAAISV